MTETNDCEECGFRDDAVTMADAVEALPAFGARYRERLSGVEPGVLRSRPAPGTWSPLGYAAHVRDVFAWYDEWVGRALVEDRPVVVAPTPDEAAELGRYDELDAGEVATALAANAERLAARFAAVPEEAWPRVHVRRGHERSVLFTARRAVHEGDHHLLDIDRGLRSLGHGAGS
ncbi:MAG: DinB family protein [Actinobacteria bacterium]|nr:DinB family protein [Actinomycetota bacterium]